MSAHRRHAERCWFFECCRRCPRAAPPGWRWKAVVQVATNPQIEAPVAQGDVVLHVHRELFHVGVANKREPNPSTRQVVRQQGTVEQGILGGIGCIRIRSGVGLESGCCALRGVGKAIDWDGIHIQAGALNVGSIIPSWSFSSRNVCSYITPALTL